MLTRRTFLGASAAALTLAALRLPRALAAPLPPADSPAFHPGWLGRTLTTYVRVYDAPNFTARQIAWHDFDELTPLLAEATGPALAGRQNTLWYQTPNGYLHAMDVQPVRYRLNRIVRHFPERGLLGEITVPYTDAHWYADKPNYTAYRLYFGSVMWVQALTADPTGRPLYRLYDERIGLTYHVPATHIRIIDPAEVEPITPDITNKRILVDLTAQTVTAYENDIPVFHTLVSTGRFRAADNPADDGTTTLSPEGDFTIIRKKPSRHMGGGYRVGTYELPGVPWVAYFSSGGYAFHGAWWHNDWGFPHSAGCINMKPAEALWLYRWTAPAVPYDHEVLDALGTHLTITGHTL